MLCSGLNSTFRATRSQRRPLDKSDMSLFVGKITIVRADIEVEGLLVMELEKERKLSLRAELVDYGTMEGRRCK